MIRKLFPMFMFAHRAAGRCFHQEDPASTCQGPPHPCFPDRRRRGLPLPHWPAGLPGPGNGASRPALQMPAQPGS